ncbi:hypothetical protein [Thermincola potens]|nr:hypothetical protein [Thermincola potens]
MSGRRALTRARGSGNKMGKGQGCEAAAGPGDPVIAHHRRIKAVG